MHLQEWKMTKKKCKFKDKNDKKNENATFQEKMIKVKLPGKKLHKKNRVRK